MNRSHVIHARVPGALLLELYSRDGLGTMVSTDFYEGAAVTEVEFMNNAWAHPQSYDHGRSKVLPEMLDMVRCTAA